MITLLFLDHRKNFRIHTHWRLPIFLLATLLSSSAAAQTRTSIRSGNWTSVKTWDCNCVPASIESVVISSGNIVTFNTSTTVRDLTVNAGGVMTDNGLQQTITGNLVVNGAYQGSGGIVLSGENTIIDGKGIIANTASIDLIDGDKTIAPTANLVKNAGNINIIGAVHVTNLGIMTVAGSIVGTVAGSTWTNGVNATLNVGSALLTNGTLDAAAPGNTVNYYGSGMQNIKIPSLVSGRATYHHLIASGANNKTLPNTTLYVEGDLIIGATLNGHGATKVLHVRGNWINNGNFNEGSGTVVFDGPLDQSIFRADGDETFNNLTIDKPGGVLILHSNIVVGTATNLLTPSTLTMSCGDIDARSNRITLGKGSGASAAAYSGALMYTSGVIRGEFKRYVNAANTDIVFPLGTSTNHRTVKIKFNDLSHGSLTARFHAAHPGNNGLPLIENGVTVRNTFRDGYWSLTTADSLMSTRYDLELTGNGFSGFAFNNQTRLLTRAIGQSEWTLNGLHHPTVLETVTRADMNMLTAEFAFGDITNCQAPPTAVITGPTSVCFDTSGDVFSIANNSSTYAWSVAGGVIAGGQGTNSIDVRWDTVGSAGMVSVVETNACTSGAAATLAVNVNPIPPSSISGKTNVPPHGEFSVSYLVPRYTDHSYTWAVEGGTIESGQGTSSISVKWGGAGSGSVCVASHHQTCGTSKRICQAIVIYDKISSVKSGSWSQASVWDCDCTPGVTDNVVIGNTHTVLLNVNNKIINNLIIKPGGLLSTGSRALTINGDLTLNGTLAGTGIISLAGPGKRMDGTGTIANTAPLRIQANSTIASAAFIYKPTGNIHIDSGVTVTNNGTVVLGGSLTGEDPSSTWINANNSSLEIEGALLTTGVLQASAEENVVHYAGHFAQDIKTPASFQYHHLAVSGLGTKTAPGLLRIKGDFTVDAPFTHNNGAIDFNGNTVVQGATTVSLYQLAITGNLVAPNRALYIGEDFINNGSFTHNDGTLIFNGTSDILGSASTTFNNVTVTGVLKGQALQLTGDLINSGTLEAGGVKFAGSKTQHVSGSSSTRFKDVTISNIALPSVRFEVDQYLYGALTLAENTTLDADGSLDQATFTIVSQNDSTDARVAAIPAGAAVIGNVQVQRYLSGEGRIYRYLSSPVKHATVADWMDDFPITGNFNDASAYPAWPKIICGVALVSQNTSMYFYDESKPGAAGDGYVAFPLENSNAADNVLEVGKGYVPFIRQCASPTVVDVKGSISQGIISLPVTYTNTSNDSLASIGWNLVGNPYPSAIDWDQAGDLNDDGDDTDVVDGWTKINIAAAIAVQDNASGMVRYWDGDGDGGIAEIPAGIIATAQGFWVRATGPNPRLIIREGVKSHEKSEFFRKEIIPTIVLSLKLGPMEDKAFIKLRPTSSESLDAWDAPKLNNGRFDLATLSRDGIAMAINAVPALGCRDTIGLQLTDAMKGVYELKISSRGDVSAHYSLQVYDRHTQRFYPIEWDEPMQVHIDETTASKDPNRLTLYILNKPPRRIRTKLVNSLCNDHGKVSILNAQPGIMYSAWSVTSTQVTESKSGNGGVIQMVIPQDSLQLGENYVIVKAQDQCEWVNVTDTLIFHYDKAVIEETKPGKSCLSGVVQLSAMSSTQGTYQWFEAQGDEPPIHQGQYFTTPFLEISKTYYVSLKTSSNCESPRHPVTATIIHYDEPVITAEGNLLRNSYDEHVQWYLNGEVIVGADSSTFLPTTSGTYSTVTAIDSCKAFASFVYTLTGIYKQENVQVFPVPAITQIVVSMERPRRLRRAWLTNSLGVHLSLNIESFNQGVAILSVEAIPAGIYLLHLDIDEKISTVKVAKIR